MSHSDDIRFQVQPGGCLQGTLRVPGDKSISHRSVMLGSLAEGVTEVTGFLEGEDALATLNAFRAMGVEIEGPDNGNVRIHGVGMRGLKAPEEPLDVGNSGTSMRLLSGLLAGQGFEVTLTGDSSLSGRPMRRVTDPPGRIVAGEVVLDGQSLLELPERRMRSVRGGQVAMIFQEPMTSLNPVFTIGNQIVEAVRLHRLATILNVCWEVLATRSGGMVPGVA